MSDHIGGVQESKPTMENCPEYSRLKGELESVLGNLAQVTTLLLDLFRAGDINKYQELDKQLELTVGEKERAVGALRQHLKEHHCQGAEVGGWVSIRS